MIPVYEPKFFGNEKKYLNEAINEGWVSSSGKFVKQFEEAIALWSKNFYAIAVCNGTAALEAAIYGLNVRGPIHLTTGTIISPYVAAKRLQKKVILFDAFPNGTPKILVRSHLFGREDGVRGSYEIDDLSQYWVPYAVKNVGIYSLYANKVITAGEGGVVVTNDIEIAKKVKDYINLSHSRERFIHYDISPNYRMSNIQAAVALAQIERIEDIIAIKKEIYSEYSKHLKIADVLDTNECVLMPCEVPWMTLITTYSDAGKIVSAMKNKGIECRRYFYPIHLQPCSEEELASAPFAEWKWNQALYLPSGLTLKKKDIKYICDSLKDILFSMTK